MMSGNLIPNKLEGFIPKTWVDLIPLIIQFGVPFAEKIWQLISSNAAPTQEDWDKLKVLTSQNTRSKMLESLTKNGIDPNSDWGKSLLELVL